MFVLAVRSRMATNLRYKWGLTLYFLLDMGFGTPIALVKKVLNPEECTLAFLFSSSTAGMCFFGVLTEYLLS